jgi:hypothetical protein
MVEAMSVAHNFERGSSKDHTIQFIFNLVNWLLKNSFQMNFDQISLNLHICKKTTKIQSTKLQRLQKNP